MTATYSAPRSDGRDLRLCQWSFSFSGATVRCGFNAIPGGQLCCEHLIAWTHEPGWVASRPDQTAADKETE